MKKKIILGIISTILIIIIISLGVIGNYFCNFALDPNNEKRAEFEKEYTTTTNIADKNEIWASSISRDEYITSNDNLKLHSNKLQNTTSTNKWAIVVHGYGGNGIAMSNYAKKYYDMGYNVLLPDLRSYGKSQGDYIGMGWPDRLDLINWINFILKSDANAEIILHGVSMGAAAVSMTSGENLPSNVKCIIADCSYTSVWDEFSYQLKTLFDISDFPVMYASSAVTKIRAGYTFGEASSVDAVAKSKTPILFIHGDKDTFVPYSMMDKLYDSASCEKEKLTVPGAKHAMSAATNPSLYWTTVSNFINKHI